jgi:hypothetical protein
MDAVRTGRAPTRPAGSICEFHKPNVTRPSDEIGQAGL